VTYFVILLKFFMLLVKMTKLKLFLFKYLSVMIVGAILFRLCRCVIVWLCFSGLYCCSVFFVI